ncbi:hypothetical protein AB0B85_11145 [Micromonospora sp. NPDC049044]
MAVVEGVDLVRHLGTPVVTKQDGPADLPGSRLARFDHEAKTLEPSSKVA